MAPSSASAPHIAGWGGMHAEPGATSFGTLLLRARKAAGLTQEELAERAGLSKRGISDLERGVRLLPRRDTLALLIEGLALSGKDLAEFVAAGHRKVLPPSVTAYAESGKVGARTPTCPPATMPSGGYLGARPLHALAARESEMTTIRAALQTSIDGNGTMLWLAG